MDMEDIAGAPLVSKPAKCQGFRDVQSLKAPTSIDKAGMVGVEHNAGGLREARRQSLARQ